jgi:hypothetical protein
MMGGRLRLTNKLNGYILGPSRATAPEPNSSRLMSLKVQTEVAQAYAGRMKYSWKSDEAISRKRWMR